MSLSVSNLTVDDFANIADSLEQMYAFTQNNQRQHCHIGKWKNYSYNESKQKRSAQHNLCPSFQQSFKFSNHTILFKLSYSYNHYNAYLCSPILSGRTTQNNKLFTSSKSMKHLISMMHDTQYISHNDAISILNTLKYKNINTRIKHEIQAASIYYQKHNLLPNETMVLIQGFTEIIKPKYIPDCVCMLIKQYYCQYMYELGNNVISFEYRYYSWYDRRYTKQNYTASICNFVMQQNNVYLFKFRIIKTIASYIDESVDILIGVTDQKYFEYYDDNRNNYMNPVQWIDLNKCQHDDVIELLIDLRIDFLMGSQVYLYKNNMRIGLTKICDNLLKDTYYPCISFKSQTHFMHEILS